MEHWQFYLRGRMLEAIGWKPQAIEAYEAALRAKADFVQPASRIAYLYAQQDRYQDAVPWFQRVLAMDPGNAVAHFNFGFILEKLGKHEQAVASFREAVRLNKSIDRAWYGMGMCLGHLGRHREAAEALEQAAELQQMNPHAWYALGMARHASNQPEQVKKIAMHLARFDPRMARRLIQEAGRADLTYLVKDLVV